MNLSVGTKLILFVALIAVVAMGDFYLTRKKKHAFSEIVDDDERVKLTSADDIAENNADARMMMIFGATMIFAGAFISIVALAILLPDCFKHPGVLLNYVGLLMPAPVIYGGILLYRKGVAKRIGVDDDAASIF